MIAIVQQEARCLVPRKGFAELLSGPRSRGVSRHTDVENAAPVVRQHQEHVQNLEPDGGYCEESTETMVVT